MPRHRGNNGKSAKSRDPISDGGTFFGTLAGLVVIVFGLVYLYIGYKTG